MTDSPTRAGQWLVYGAYGFTGRLIVEEALRRGQRPLMAGRNRAKLEALARETGLPYHVAALDDAAALAQLIGRVELVLHAAGPFIHTAPAMMAACLAQGAHYADITGELPVFAHAWSLHNDAHQRGIVIMPGVGFDVVPSDCLAAFVAAQVPGAEELDLAFAAGAHPSAGTLSSMVEHFPAGGFVRRRGHLVPHPLGRGARRVRLACGERRVVPIPWGDLETAYRSTGIPNITTYVAYPGWLIATLRWLGAPLRMLLSRPAVRHYAQAFITRRVQGPDERTRQQGHAYLWARARNPQRSKEAWLVTGEPYQLTARTAVSAVERILAGGRRGALTPAQAFGPDFVLTIEGVKRIEALP